MFGRKEVQKLLISKYSAMLLDFYNEGCDRVEVQCDSEREEKACIPEHYNALSLYVRM